MQNARMKPPSMDDVVSMFQASGLKSKLIFTFLMIAVFRLGVHLPLYGINNEMFARLAQSNNIIGFIDLFSGGALANISILALGLGPYITSSIIMQLLTVVIPHLEQLIESFDNKRKEFADVIKMGRTQLEDAVPMTLGQTFGAFANILRNEIEHLNEAARDFLTVNMGATAIGTGI